MRRHTLAVAIAGLMLTACTSTGRREFVSDRISVVTRGTGPDIILIPGLTGHRDQWADVADILDDRYRLHLVQVNGFAGFPANANADGPVSATVTEEVARYIAEAGLARPAVIGHSMGGTIGMMLSARHRERVGRLMVIDMMPFMGEAFGSPGGDVRAAADQFRAQILNNPPGEGMLGQMVPTMTLTSEKLPMLMQGLRDSDKRTVANAFHELIITDLRPELRNVTAPLTVLYVVPPNLSMSEEQFDAAMRRLYANAPNMHLIKITDSRHFIQWDRPARFIAEVEAFMK